MNLFSLNKTIDRLNQMVDNAIEGRPIENGFDESKISSLETKLSHFLAMNNTTKVQLAEEKLKVHELVSDISHQTKTPLANILLHSMLLSESDLSEHDRLCVNALSEQVNKLNFLISALVKGSRLETGIISVSAKQGGISQLLQDVLCQAEPTAKVKNVMISIETTDINASFDPKWTTEALFNIVDNAIKYTPKGGTVKISATAYQMFCRIDVEDSGIGIDEEDMPKIFTRFYRSPRVRDHDGVGIGLYLSRQIISGQGGYIKVQSKIGKGSTFSLFLPIND
ncbi:MAG: HAMP domain-containing sensor histidine kinase [Bacillota bacterium]|nr:HAMP domain-containing sensor histidine kinase [Bacillota bacterium]